jgi:hypothetical protein
MILLRPTVLLLRIDRRHQMICPTGRNRRANNANLLPIRTYGKYLPMTD